MSLRVRILSAMTPGRGYTVRKLVNTIQTPDDDPMTFHTHVQVQVAQLASAGVLYKRRIQGRKFGMPRYTYHLRSAKSLAERGLDPHGRVSWRKPQAESLTPTRVLEIASSLPAEFRRRDLVAAMPDHSAAAVDKWLERLMVLGRVERVRFGWYALTGRKV